MINLYTKEEMINAVEKYLESEGYEHISNYDRSFDPARVPIWGERELSNDIHEEVFVDIITESTIKSSFYFRKKSYHNRSLKDLEINNASSAQFYRHFFPYAKVYWAIPNYLKDDDEYREFEKNCQNEKIGLIKVIKESNEFRAELKIGSTPLLREKEEVITGIIEEIIQEPIEKKHRQQIKKKLEEFSDEDIMYLTFYPDPQYLAADVATKYENRLISKELINRIGELEKVHYKEILKDFIGKYYDQYVDDYKLALDLTEMLWRVYGLKFPELHKDFEEVLKLDSRYRDHFLHAFQVFLYGVYVIDILYDSLPNVGFNNEIGNKVEDAWLLAATYHDYNYMIQKFDKWSNEFFKKALHLNNNENNPASLQLGEFYVKEGYMFLTKELARILNLRMDQETLDFLFDRILIKKNHGLISSLSLMKCLTLEDNKNNNKFKPRVIESATKAIAIHDLKIWRFLSGKALDNEDADDGKPDDIGIKFKQKKVLGKLSFSEDPISFLLILADSLQEEGRESSRFHNLAELDALFLKDGKIYTEISFSGDDSDEASRLKNDELKKVRDFLGGEKKFVIEIKDVEAEESHKITI